MGGNLPRILGLRLKITPKTPPKKSPEKINEKKPMNLLNML